MGSWGGLGGSCLPIRSFRGGSWKDLWAFWRDLGGSCRYLWGILGDVGGMGDLGRTFGHLRGVLGDFEGILGWILGDVGDFGVVLGDLGETWGVKSGTDVLQTRRDSQCVFLLTQSLVK